VVGFSKLYFTAYDQRWQAFGNVSLPPKDERYRIRKMGQRVSVATLIVHVSSSGWGPQSGDGFVRPCARFRDRAWLKFGRRPN